METIVGAILGILGLYLALGFVFGIVFIFLGVQRVDPAAAGAGIFFRLMILPDVLIYFASGESQSETLPADAFLLGPASVGRNVYRLPPVYPAAPGRLLYFSLATQELLDQVALPATPEQGGAM